MDCNGCGNPFCNAGRLMKAWRELRFVLILVAAWTPALLLGYFMPLPWAFIGTGIYVYALYRILLAFGAEIMAKVSAAQMAEMKRTMENVAREIENGAAPPGSPPSGGAA